MANPITVTKEDGSVEVVDPYSYKDRKHEEHRLYVQRYKEAHPCRDCGETNWIVLQFDHVRGRKVANISEMVARAVSQEKLEGEIAKCEVVCANCHIIRERRRESGELQDKEIITVEDEIAVMRERYEPSSLPYETCAGPECEKDALYRTAGLCPGHYQQQRKGLPLTPLLTKIHDGRSWERHQSAKAKGQARRRRKAQAKEVSQRC